MWRTSRSLSAKSIGRPPEGPRGSGGTANTPRRASGVSGAIFIVRSSERILLRQRVISRNVPSRPRAAGGPLRGWIGPEGLAGGKAQRQEGDGAEVEAAGADVGLGEMRLVAGQAHVEPAALVERARRLQ